LRVLVSGSSGLIGTAVVREFAAGGGVVTRLVRRAPTGPAEVSWDPVTGALDRARLSGFDAVIHLAGESLARGRWTGARKASIRDSRVQGTRLLCEALAEAERPPRVLISASAIGYYGDRGDEVLTEESPPGQGFLPDVAQAWEAAAASAAARGIRVVRLRNALVLAAHGGVLAKMLPPFRLGLGATLGNGRAWWSWVALDDVIGIIRCAVECEELDGAINVASPMPVRSAAFSETLGRVLRRPVLVRIPAAAVRLVFGEMADQTLLASTRVEPARLVRADYRFRFPELEGTLRHLVGSPSAARGRGAYRS
jgi:hypothetical protein